MQMINRPFHEPSIFHWIKELKSQYHTIYKEFLEVQHALIDYVEPNLYDAGWKVFGLWNLPHRQPILNGFDSCPQTSALIENLVPLHGAAAFSVLMPGTRIHAHRGKPGPYLRCHLALEVPNGDCKIRVNGEIKSWETGQALILDDRMEHDAWNLTESRRVVLLIDFIP
jgi:beta-hydroxylase